MRRNSTQAQREAATDRRQRMRTLARQISSMTEAQRQALIDRCGTIVTIEGRGLSIHNTCMLLLQRPDTSVVGGFRQWIHAGRAVRKGEHGLTIWIPVGAGAKRDQQEPIPGPVHSSDEIPETRFMLGTVFDISQTDELVTASAPQPVESECAA